MLQKIKIKNCFIFKEEVLFDLTADKRNSRLAFNVHNNEFKTLKVAGIYGSNNSGKTCLIKSIKAIKSIINK